MTRYTGKNGAAGVGDTNPGVDVWVEEIGEFSNGGHVVVIGLNADPIPSNMRDMTRDEQLLVEKARRLAKATLGGAISCYRISIKTRPDVRGALDHQSITFKVSRIRVR